MNNPSTPLWSVLLRTHAHWYNNHDVQSMTTPPRLLACTKGWLLLHGSVKMLYIGHERVLVVYSVSLLISIKEFTS